MKENSIEEDITLIEKSLCDKDTIIQYHYWVGTDFLNAVERIVADYKRVLKENEEWQRAYQEEKDKQFDLIKENEELKVVKSAIQTLQINSIEDEKYIVISKSSFLDGSYKHLLDDYIPVQKIKDKIEELKKKVEELTDEKGYWGGSDLLEQIKVLQQLLEKEQ